MLGLTFVCPVYPTRMINYSSLHSLMYVSLCSFLVKSIFAARVGAILKHETPCTTIWSTIRIHRHDFVFLAPWRIARNLLKHLHVLRRHRWILAINANYGSEWFFKNKSTVNNSVPLDWRTEARKRLILCNRRLFNVEIKYQSLFRFVQSLCWTVCCQNKVSFAFLIFTSVHKSTFQSHWSSSLFMNPHIYIIYLSNTRIYNLEFQVEGDRPATWDLRNSHSNWRNEMISDMQD